LNSKYIKDKMLKGNGRNLKKGNGARFPQTALKYHLQKQGIKDTKGKMKGLYWFLIILGIIFFQRILERSRECPIRSRLPTEAQYIYIFFSFLEKYYNEIIFLSC